MMAQSAAAGGIAAIRRNGAGNLDVIALRTGSTYRVIHSFPSWPYTQKATRPPSLTREARLAKPAAGSGKWCRTPTEKAKSNTGRAGGVSKAPITTGAVGDWGGWREGTKGAPAQ